jgi:hypothetical protein
LADPVVSAEQVDDRRIRSVALVVETSSERFAKVCMYDE